jgi:hypothetical protein
LAKNRAGKSKEKQTQWENRFRFHAAMLTSYAGAVNLIFHFKTTARPPGREARLR